MLNLASRHAALNRLGASVAALSMFLCAPAIASAQVLTFGDVDALGFGYGSFNPIAGTTQIGLAPNVSTFGAEFNHGLPFVPEADDFGGTDRMTVGSVQTGSSDGYSRSPNRVSGPLVGVLDYSSLVPANTTVTTLTLGIAADDFEFPLFGQPFNARINGLPNAALTSILNGLSLTNPQVRYLTLGLDPSVYVNGARTLTVSIDEGGTGGDGFAVDFFTVGVTSVAVVPEAGTFALLAPGLIGAGLLVARRRK